MVKLPEALLFSPVLCHRPSGKCIQSAVVGAGQPGEIRVGAHAFDRSYAELNMSLANLTVTISWATSEGGRRLDWHIQPVLNQTLAPQFDLRLEASYGWMRAGTVAAACHHAGGGSAAAELRYDSLGLGSTSLSVIGQGAAATHCEGRNVSVVGMTAQGIALSTVRGSTIREAVGRIAAARAAERTRYAAHGAALAPVKEAVQASAMWNLIYVPAEAGPFSVISRGGWSFTRGEAASEWRYVMADWDNLLASYLFGALGEPMARDAAFSSAIQVVRSKTKNGFVPNWSAAGLKSQDRSEEVIGAKVLLELYRAYGAAEASWLVELLFDDLLDWLHWIDRRRTLEPLGLICLGSDNISRMATYHEAPGSICGVQGARYEQADNLPTFDCPGSDPVTGKPDGPGCALLFNRTRCQMTTYNAGQTGLVTMELLALADLADAISRPEGSSLRARAHALQGLAREHLWDDGYGVFADRFADGCPDGLLLCENGFYRRISPTSLFPLLGGVATDAQATTMIHQWVLNASRFCISARGDFAGSRDDCYWGLPSISADDPAFAKLGYWRGFVWAPWAQLSWWALDTYSHVPAVRQARRALAKQMTAMMMVQWREHRHICENFSPWRNATECTGTWFYHWGGLAGLLSLLEERKSGRSNGLD